MPGSIVALTPRRPLAAGMAYRWPVWLACRAAYIRSGSRTWSTMTAMLGGIGSIVIIRIVAMG